jgi:hypothetical protein
MMTAQPTSRNPWRWIAILAILARSAVATNVAAAMMTAA